MKYGFIGCGNMGSAVARALSQATKDILVTDRSGKAAAVAKELGIAYGSNEAAAESCDRLYLCVKPQMMEAVLLPLRPFLQARKPLLITMAAGLTLQQIENFAGCALPVIRIMPNTPTAVGKGVIQYCRNELVTDAMLREFLEDMRYAGILDALGYVACDDEKHADLILINTCAVRQGAEEKVLGEIGALKRLKTAR